MTKVQFGIDSFLRHTNDKKQLRYGLVTNNVATTSGGEPSRLALLKAGFTIKKLFSPEHGLTAKGEDGSFQSNSIDTMTDLPVISLYSNRLQPSHDDLNDIDIILFDIPDVGCRFYTYLWTMTYVMEACAANDKPIIIFDRPNPIGGDLDKAEGPGLDETSCSSFIGRWNIPVRHSCTLGELATYFAGTKINNCDLQIIKVKNWNRLLSVSEANWHFLPTSPAIRDAETALLYPGMGLLEGINVNEGRGTEYPFKICGAPWIDDSLLYKAFAQSKPAGIVIKEISYIPETGIYSGATCYGLKISLTDAHSFKPVKTVLQLLHLITRLFPGKCEERLYPTVANPSGRGHLDKLTGIPHSFEKIKTGSTLSTDVNYWKETIRPFLLY